MLRRVLGLLVLLGIGAAVLGIGVLQVYVDQPTSEGVRRPLREHLVVDAGEEGARGPEISASAGWNRVPRGSRIPLSVLIDAQRTESVSHVTAMAGFYDSNLAAWIALSPCPAVGSVIRLCGRLEPDAVRTPTNHWLQVVVSWQQAGRAHSERLDLGPLITYNPVEQWWAEFLTNTVDLLKGLALPLALLVIGWLYKQQQDERQQLSETWNLMLPLCQEYAEKYYTPLLAAVRGVQRSHREHQYCEAAFYFVGLLAHMRAMARDRGGIFLKDRTGERVISLSWSAILAWAKTMPDASNYWTVVDAMDRYEGLHEFERRFDRTKTFDLPLVRAFHAYKEKFIEWCNKPGAAVRLEVMRVFELVLDYEMNSVHRHWYSRKERFPLADLNASLAVFQSALEGGGDEEPSVREVRQALATYLRRRPSLLDKWLELWRRPVSNAQ